MDNNEKLRLIRLKVEELQGVDELDEALNVNVQSMPWSALDLLRKSNAGDGLGDLSTTAGSPLTTALGLVGLASSGLSAYHGYKRNDSVGWAIGWGILGGIFPIITPAVAFAQGFGQPIKKAGSASNPSSAREALDKFKDSMGMSESEAKAAMAEPLGVAPDEVLSALDKLFKVKAKMDEDKKGEK